MKKLLVVLLSLSLIVGLSTAASAASTFRINGAYELFGIYEDNGTGLENSNSRATLWQRARFVPFWQIDEGLTFTARIDALEKDWGTTAWKTNFAAPGSTAFTTVDETSSRKSAAAMGDVKVQENIEFERSYVTFATKIGQFQVGYQEAAVWGTKFGDYNITRPRARWSMPFGPLTLLAIWEKNIEVDNFAYAPTGIVDGDTDSYYIAGIFKQGSIEAGLLYGYTLGSTTRFASGVGPAGSAYYPDGFRIKLQTLQPYVKATFGPVYVEAEVDYMFGTSKEYDTEGISALTGLNRQNQDREGWGAYGKVQVNIGPAYVGGLVIWNAGDNDNPATDTKDTSGTWSKDINPALILMNNDIPDPLPGQWASDDPRGLGRGAGSKKEQMTMYNLFGGYKATPKLAFDASLSLAYSSKTFKTGQYIGVNGRTLGGAYGTEYVSDELGTEFDVTATYKIFDNLSYMVGAGYLWTGDFFKGADNNRKVENDYTFLHKLTLSF